MFTSAIETAIETAIREVQLQRLSLENAKLKSELAQAKTEVEHYKVLLEREKLNKEPDIVKQARKTIFDYENNHCLVCGEQHGNGLPCPKMRVT